MGSNLNFVDFTSFYNFWYVFLHIYHHIIENHHSSSRIITHHRESSLVIENHHSSPRIITHHRESSLIIENRHKIHKIFKNDIRHINIHRIWFRSRFWWLKRSKIQKNNDFSKSSWKLESKGGFYIRKGSWVWFWGSRASKPPENSKIFKF